MVRILAADGLDASAVHRLEERGYEVLQQHYEPDELGKALEDVDVLLVRSATKVREPVIDQAVAAGRLKMIIRGGVGMDNIDVDYARGKGSQSWRLLICWQSPVSCISRMSPCARASGRRRRTRA